MFAALGQQRFWRSPSSPPSLRHGARNVAALQVALRALHRYHGGIDGIDGQGTRSALRSFQRRHGLAADGVAGPQTRRALGRRGSPSLGSRVMQLGDRGWDVAALQFMLASAAIPPARSTAATARTRALRWRASKPRWAFTWTAPPARGRLSALQPSHATQYQHGAELVVQGTPAGPVRFLRPLNVPMGDGFGYPGGRRHDGIDFPAPAGTPIGAAGVGTVMFAGWNSGGYGNLVIVQHRLGFQTWYAHLSRFAVSVGSRVAGGVRIGYVGSTGHATGPHLHFEVRLNGTPVNPLPYFLAASSLGKRAVRPARSRRMETCPAKPAPPRGTRESPRTAELAC